MTDDPWVMYLVVRKDHPLSRRRAMTLAGAGAVRCADRFRPEPAWTDAFAAWQQRPRKVALRADATEMDAIAQLGAEPVETELGVTLLALPPRLRSSSEALLASLRPYTDGPRPSEEPPPPEGLHLVYTVRPGVLRTAGKAMAQAGHAALMAADALDPEAVSAWRAAGCPGEVEEVDDETWASRRAAPDAVVVADAGLTQVEPGTETVIARLER
jgi:peptidyl-tRNA hydrolase